MARVRYTRQPVSFVLESVRKQKGRERKRMNEWDLEHCHCCGSYARRCWRWPCLCFSCPGHVLGCLKLNAFKQLNVRDNHLWTGNSVEGRWKVEGERKEWVKSVYEGNMPLWNHFSSLWGQQNTFVCSHGDGRPWNQVEVYKVLARSPREALETLGTCWCLQHLC